MKSGVPVVADLSAGDAEMHRVIEDTVNALGGLDIIVNRHIFTHTSLRRFNSVRSSTKCSACTTAMHKVLSSLLRAITGQDSAMP